MTMTSATSQPASACGPPSADISSGIVMNGPTPIMLDMFSAVDCSRPKRRSRVGGGLGAEDIRPPILSGYGIFALARFAPRADHAHYVPSRALPEPAAGHHVDDRLARSGAGDGSDVAPGRRVAALRGSRGGSRPRTPANGDRLRDRARDEAATRLLRPGPHFRPPAGPAPGVARRHERDRKSTRLNS